MRRLGLLAAGLMLLATGCGTTRASVPLPADVSGRWSGTWYGYGILDIPRSEAAKAELNQTGQEGHGRLVLENAVAASSVSPPMRWPGLTGARVSFVVKGSKVVMRHELGGQIFTADFEVTGDRMVGKVRDTDPYVTIVLERVRPEASAPEPRPIAAPPPPVPPPPPPPVALAPPPEPPPAPAPAIPAPPPPPVAAPPPVAPPPPPAVAMTPAPAPPPPPPAQFALVPGLERIHFEFDSAELPARETRILDANARWLREHPDLLLLIEGHCDERGTAEYNLALGERRARAARDYLVSREVAPERVAIVSYGKERPLCAERNDACWRLNRRADFLVKPR